jgi:superfamily I DNA and/or RNA helicase
MLFNKLMNQNVNKSSSFFDSYKNVAIMKRQYRMNQNIFNLIKPIYDIHPGFELLDAKQVLVNNDLMCIQINGTEKEDGTSFINDDESFAIVSLLKQITENFENYKNIKTIGVITAYRAQEQYIYKQASKLGIRSNNVNIQYGTIDRFQGKEYDLVLLSLVRTKSMGFTDNIRRMNVSFSRAKNHLIIFGNYEEINEIVISNSRQNFISTNLDEEEDKFVYEQLIPKLYKLRKTFNSNEERNEFILNSFKGNSYE